MIFFFCWIYLTLLPFHFLRVASINSKCVEGEKKKVPNIQNTILSRKHNANLRAHTHTHTPIVYINIREYANYSHSLLTAWMVKELKKCEIRLFQTFFLSTSETICQHRRAWRWSEIKVKVHNYCVFFFFRFFAVARSLMVSLLLLAIAPIVWTYTLVVVMFVPKTRINEHWMLNHRRATRAVDES